MKVNQFILDSHIEVLHDRYYHKHSDSNCRKSINALASGAGGSLVLTANTVYAWPFIIDKPLKITSIASTVLANVSGSSMRMALYRDNGNFYPGQIVPRTDTGAISSATNGVKTGTFAPMRLVNGYYWGCVQSNGAITLRSNQQAVAYKALGFNPTTLTPNSNWEIAFTFGAFPGRFPNGATLSNRDVPHMFFNLIKV